ncbi:YrhA family protein [Pseudomonas alliivorans]|uniref:Knr4/Smi1-like domain-containing protein n=1 Tax=Pseudomonas floridensis TaxID=1958950 RepID=A0A1X0N0C4_9PSED|nr:MULTISPECIES: YrhA family protein [Pseudomonas]MBP0953935.1 SMI1/KNR4 family protein [Pseudomonas alliivorans]MEE4576380.1 YrhA family protein [Pseudomonas alliivorans]MEE4688325.1 YrhA family protein [Pseudomonas alliivorans]MEE4709092.1 YrhA family protein [Pseudomonas alliivorans]MEE4780721.1 YrhA family protein [Pseudomonas alliivorans]
MNKKIQSKIAALRSSLDEADMFLGAAATDEDIRNLEAKCLSELQATLPKQYLDFLRAYDGLISGGVFIYSSRPHKFRDSVGYSHALVDQNLIARDLDFMSDFLVFGESDMDVYVLEVASKNFQVRDRQVIDNVFEEFQCFDELLEFMIDLIILRA